MRGVTPPRPRGSPWAAEGGCPARREGKGREPVGELKLGLGLELDPSSPRGRGGDPARLRGAKWSRTKRGVTPHQPRRSPWAAEGERKGKGLKDQSSPRG